MKSNYQTLTTLGQCVTRLTLLVALTFALSAPAQAALQARATQFPLYVATGDAYNTIVKVDSAGNQTVFVSEADGDNPDNPIALAFDISGNLYVANNGSNTIVKVDSAGNKSVFTSGGLSPFPLASRSTPEATCT